MRLTAVEPLAFFTLLRLIVIALSHAIMHKLFLNIPTASAMKRLRKRLLLHVTISCLQAVRKKKTAQRVKCFKNMFA